MPTNNRRPANSRSSPQAPRPAETSPRPAVSREVLEKAKRASVFQLLFRCARLADERALDRLSSKYGVRIRPAHTALFPHVDLEGTQQVELARRVGISKQAIGKLVAELEEYGVLERIPDPTDARATLVRFSSAPGRTLLDGLAQLGEFEAEAATAVGTERWRALHETLLRLDDWLSTRPSK